MKALKACVFGRGAFCDGVLVVQWWVVVFSSLFVIF